MPGCVSQTKGTPKYQLTHSLATGLTKITYAKGKSWSHIDHIVASSNVNTSKNHNMERFPSPDHHPISIQLVGKPISYNLDNSRGLNSTLPPTKHSFSKT
eukprot:TRINITY_DN8038_c0_g3_i4.p1 TRINITY_DN8038_c0_g3~~TRINITY_DN8038_c0_g3_i4.p1  ORF type:complete len:100 (-),score=8.02 TRINITY_DN8038_c0_g3_i4:465-764(-)